MAKKYIISATEFKTKSEAEEQIQDWILNDTYNHESIIYEINDNTPRYMSVIKLKKLP